jgi:hypothetical protein
VAHVAHETETAAEIEAGWLLLLLLSFLFLVAQRMRIGSVCYPNLILIHDLMIEEMSE